MHLRRRIPSIVEVEVEVERPEVLGDVERITLALPKRVLRPLEAQAGKADMHRLACVASRPTGLA